jgi:hypothetical protein
MLKEIFAELNKKYSWCMIGINEAGCVEIHLINNNGEYLISYYWEEDEDIAEALKTIEKNMSSGNRKKKIEQFLFTIKRQQDRKEDVQEIVNKFRLFLSLTKTEDVLRDYLTKSKYFKDIDLTDII